MFARLHVSTLLTSPRITLLCAEQLLHSVNPGRILFLRNCDMKVIVLRSSCLVYMLIKSHSGILHICTHAIPSSGACEKFRPGSSRTSTSNYQNRRAPCTFCNTLEWVSSASCPEPERLCSLTLNSFLWNKLCCALALVSVIFPFIAQGSCGDLDNRVIKPLYVHVGC